MKKFQALLFLVAISFFVFNLFNNGGSSNYEPEPQTTLGDFVTYGQRGVLNDWPPLAKSGNDGIAETLTASNYYLIVDGSGSMGDERCSGGRTKMDAAKSALQEFVQQIPANANIGVYSFDQRGEGERLALGVNNGSSAMQEINTIRASGSTPLAKSISDGVTALTQQARKQLGYGEYNLVVITDGAANSTEALNRSVQKMLKQTPILLHTIGFCIDERHALNKPGYTLYKSANDPRQLRESLSAVLAEAPSFDVSSFPDES